MKQLYQGELCLSSFQCKVRNLAAAACQHNEAFQVAAAPGPRSVLCPSRWPGVPEQISKQRRKEDSETAKPGHRHDPERKACSCRLPTVYLGAIIVYPTDVPPVSHACSSLVSASRLDLGSGSGGGMAPFTARMGRCSRGSWPNAGASWCPRARSDFSRLTRM